MDVGERLPRWKRKGWEECGGGGRQGRGGERHGYGARGVEAEPALRVGFGPRRPCALATEPTAFAGHAEACTAPLGVHMAAVLPRHAETPGVSASLASERLRTRQLPGQPTRLSFKIP